MNKNYKVTVEDFNNYGCDDLQVAFLIDLFSTLIKTMEDTLTRKSWFDMKDFYDSKTYGVDRYQLLIMRKNFAYTDTEQWFGIFFYDGKKLEITATLDK